MYNFNDKITSENMYTLERERKLHSCIVIKISISIYF
jgi:hypothetical protein